MAKDYYTKDEILRVLDLSKAKWIEYRNSPQKQDVTHENFIDDVILAYGLAISDIENM